MTFLRSTSGRRGARPLPGEDVTYTSNWPYEPLVSNRPTVAEYFPYTVTRSWHTQLAVLWIATAWLATGLYVAPLLSKKDPKFQVWGVFHSELLGQPRSPRRSRLPTAKS
jgi:nitric oxide reductase large subunit